MDELDGLFRNNLNKEGKDASQEGQTGTDIPGRYYNPNNGIKTTLRPKRLSEIQIHNKTVRSICAKFPGLNANVIEVMGIIELYLELHNKHHERAQEIVNWSGSRTAWQRKQHHAIRQGIETGYLEQYKQMIVLSPKAERIISLYDAIYEESERNYINKAEARKTQPKQKRRNIRRQGEPQAA
jgi:hypothetical protein